MRLRRIMLLSAVVLMLICCFFLPNAVAGFTDMSTLDNYIMIDSESVSFDFEPELSLSERISLVANQKTEILTLKSGQVMNYETAGGRAAQELLRFFRGSSFAFDFNRHVVENGAASFIYVTGDPSVSMIIWEFYLVDPFGNAATITIDDETGVMLKLIYTQGSLNLGLFGPADANNTEPSDEELNVAAIRLVEMMATYYGQPVIIGDYQYSVSRSLGYYRADLSEGGVTVPMYGVVRESSFTMNERV